MGTRLGGALVLLGFLAPSVGTAQSLEEAAAREAARRQQLRGSRTYTNKDLPKPTPLPKSEPAESAAGVLPPSEQEPSAEPRRSEEPEPRPEAGPPAKTEAEWRLAADAARSAVARAQAQLKAAEEEQIRADRTVPAAVAWASEGRPEGPEAVFVAIEESTQAQKVVDEAKASLAAAEAALESLVTEATGLGVPDSWWAPKPS